MEISIAVLTEVALATSGHSTYLATNLILNKKQFLPWWNKNMPPLFEWKHNHIVRP